VNAILADGTFVPRAVTRNTSSEKALKLKAQGVEVVEADLWDVESLKKAIAGSECIFGVSPLLPDNKAAVLLTDSQVTNFFDPSIYSANQKGEIEQGKNLIAASKAVGIKFFIWR